MKKYAVYSGTRNVYHLLIPSIKSLLYNSDVDEIFLLIEDDEFPEPLPQCVKTINVSNQQFFKPGGPNYACSWSYMVLLRAAYCYILPEYVDKVLSLDMDTIVLHDISDLWGFDISNYYFAGVEEPDKSNPKDDFLYVNMGVTLHNLPKLREEKAERIIQVLNVSKFTFPEQDVFNIYCAGKVLELPAEYNCSICTKKATAAWIRHFAAEPIEKWTKSSQYKRYKQMSWREALQGRPM